LPKYAGDYDIIFRTSTQRFEGRLIVLEAKAP
jgi:hypothetical protein